MLNWSMVLCFGVFVRKIDILVFVFGSGLVGIVGSLFILFGLIGFIFGLLYFVDVFMIVILGGIGKLKGIIIGVVMVGLLSIFVEYFISVMIVKVVVFVCIIFFL